MKKQEGKPDANVEKILAYLGKRHKHQPVPYQIKTPVAFPAKRHRCFAQL